jgi:hypothetical protein
MIHFADPGYELLVLRIFKEIKEKKRQFCINLLRVTQPCRYSKGLSKKKLPSLIQGNGLICKQG